MLPQNDHFEVVKVLRRKELALQIFPWILIEFNTR